MKRKEVIFLLAMLLVGTSVGGFAYPSNCYAATAETESSLEQSIYSLANHYFKIKSISNGKYLLGNKAGYEAQADTADSGMTFYFKASDLGEYILFDQDSKYLTYNTFNAIVRNKTLSDKTRFKVEQYEDNSFSFYSYVKKKYVGIKGTSLVWKDNVDDTCRFELELTEGNNPFPEADINIDFYDGDGNPITTSNVMARPSSGENIIGTADTHAHLCHNKGSGEVVFNGDAFSPLGIADALNDCTDLHGVNGAYDIWGKAVDGATTHNTSGYPNFSDWPTSYSTNHEQTYYKWLERSYLAGQRVLVHQCVNNEILGKVTNVLPPYKNGVTNDMDAIRQEIEYVYKMQDYIDAQCGGPNEGWFRIVTSSEQARDVISQGKMAVFLGIEVDTIFGADTDFVGKYNAGEITEEEMNTGLENIEKQLDEVYDLGIRSFYMIHALNNGFGGCQLYQGEIFSIMNYLKTSDFYQPEVSTNPRVFYKQPKADLPEDAQGHANVEGLTETGKWMIHQMINRHMIIELDHMSDKSLNDTLDILWEEKYPGIICSHTRILDMFNPEDEAWEQLDIPRMIKIYQLGGIISPMMWETTTGHQRCATDYLEYMIELSNNSETPTTGILDNQNYFKYDGPYEVPTTWYNMNDDESDDMILGIPYGSDVNGACMLPNFDKVQESFDTVDYDTFTDLYPGIYADGVTAKVNKQTTGNVTFDVNGDRGVAHYGLVPDFWKKMSTNSNIVDINATFNSAEAYIRMIERAEKYSDTYPSRDESQWITTSTEYWH